MKNLNSLFDKNGMEILGGGSTVKKGSITIPVLGWVTGSGDWNYKLDLPIVGIDANMIVQIFYEKDSIDTAIETGISAVDSYNGGVYLYSDKIPTEPILGYYIVVTTGSLQGMDGNTWLSGSVAPTNQGVEGDFYLNTSSYEVYKKVGTSWGSPLMNIKGANGTAGTNGTNGTNGLTVSVNNIAHSGGNITINQDDILSGTTNKVFTNTEKTKLSTIDYSNDIFTITDVAEPVAPVDGKLALYARKRAGRMLMHMKGPAGIATALQPALFGNTVYMWLPSSGTTVSIAFGTPWIARNTTGKQGTPTKSIGNLLTSMNRATFDTTAAANTASGTQSTQSVAVRGNTDGIGGFFFFSRFGIETWSGTGQQVFIGLSALNAVLGGEPSAQNNTIGIGCDAADNTWQLIFRSASATTKVNTTIPIVAGEVFDLQMFAKPNDSKVTIRVVRQNDGVTIIDDVDYSTNLPANNVFLFAHAIIRNTGTAINRLALNRIYVEVDV